MKQSRHVGCRRDLVLIMKLTCCERPCRTAESNASNGPVHGLEALDRDILLIPLPEPHDVQQVGGGPPQFFDPLSVPARPSFVRLMRWGELVRW
jgi:hypothetical protein